MPRVLQEVYRVFISLYTPWVCLLVCLASRRNYLGRFALAMLPIAAVNNLLKMVGEGAGRVPCASCRVHRPITYPPGVVPCASPLGPERREGVGALEEEGNQSEEERAGHKVT